MGRTQFVSQFILSQTELKISEEKKKEQHGKGEKKVWGPKTQGYERSSTREKECWTHSVTLSSSLCGVVRNVADGVQNGGGGGGGGEGGTYSLSASFDLWANDRAACPHY